MAEKSLPHGPWTTIFEGNWDKHKVEFFQNPDKETLTLIYAEGGQVVILNKYFVFDGNYKNLIKILDCHAQVIEKYYPTFRAKYFVVSSGPDFYSDKDIKNGVEKSHKMISRAGEKVRRYSEDYNIEFTDLSKADSKYGDRLFSEPTTLLATTARAMKGEISAESKEGQIVLGKTVGGEDAVENIEILNSIVVKGNIEGQVHAFKVIAENCISNNLSAIMFDENKYFEKMSYPNKDLDAFDEYVNLQPVGMPLKTPALERVPISLRIINGKMLAELVGVAHEGSAKKAVEIIGKTLEGYKGKIEWLEDLEDLLRRNMDDAQKFDTYRAIRILKIVDNLAGAYIGGKTEMKNLTGGKLNKMGIITRIDLVDLPENLKKLFVLSVIETLNANPSKSLGNILFISEAQRYAGKNAETEIGKKIFEALESTNKNGSGFCVGTEILDSLHPEILTNAKLTLEFISKGEAAVKGPNKKTYRVKLRPSLSG